MLRSFTFDKEGVVCVCVYVYVYVHVHIYLYCFCLKALESCLNNAVSSAKIPEGRGELTACSCYFPRGICGLNKNIENKNIVLFSRTKTWEKYALSQVHCWRTNKPAVFWQSYYVRWIKLKIWEAKTQWETGCKTESTVPQYTCRISETVQGKATKNSAESLWKQKEPSAILPENMSIINSTCEKEGTSQVAQW